MTDLVDTVQQEIGDRLNELKPFVEESKRLQVAAAALNDSTESMPVVSTPAASTPAASKSAAPKRRRRAARPKVSARKRRRAPLSANQRAIVAALEHGAHTVRELVTVTGMGDQTARNNVKGLVGLEKVVKAERGGKTAYALAVSGE